MNDDNYTNVILEEVRSQYQAIQEGFDDNKRQFETINGRLDSMDDRLENIDGRLANIETDMELVKHIATDHEKRITTLEK